MSRRYRVPLQNHRLLPAAKKYLTKRKCLSEKPQWASGRHLHLAFF
ncbi:hypothetical protein HMPREF9370_0369 [Neisseria wadsworthii 9715]|uniref:Uncharacterized protein n=1 Tax=Neisseria wadsworthii 9715 TaxID=1030841 RepID=G4CMR0_9NEIS|nr:hypothetical protein HMPREF9370_0369 [Neisseria wadsworthii 9715]